MTLTQVHISENEVSVHTYPKSVSGPFILTVLLDLDNILHNCCPWPNGMPWHWPKVISGAVVVEWLSSWLAEQEDRGSIPGLATWVFRDWLSPASKSRYGWKIAKSTLILKTTNQPTQGNISKVKVHTYPKPCPGHNSSLPCWILIIYHTIVSWPWLRFISPRSRSQFTHGKTLFQDHYLSWVTWMGMILHTIVVHDPGFFFLFFCFVLFFARVLVMTCLVSTVHLIDIILFVILFNENMHYDKITKMSKDSTIFTSLTSPQVPPTLTKRQIISKLGR